MKQFAFTLILLIAASTAFAEGNGDKNKKSEITPKTELSNDAKSFEVNTLKACTGEFDNEDAVSEFVEEEATIRLMELIPLTEGVEESSTSTYNEETTSASVNQL